MSSIDVFDTNVGTDTLPIQGWSYFVDNGITSILDGYPVVNTVISGGSVSKKRKSKRRKSKRRKSKRKSKRNYKRNSRKSRRKSMRGGALNDHSDIDEFGIGNIPIPKMGRDGDWSPPTLPPGWSKDIPTPTSRPPKKKRPRFYLGPEKNIKKNIKKNKG